ncbi:uncharacterized protein LOC123317774 [Coccinella septempunctata]|uniref:uncharacterized protein LOC123317774 n=1 Tax=Coccinella septempunctata TaxID=41139 RepID=UPI001D0826B8|nr:uncharacterized protein LOC123317774 [Coccinella septempunctata]
MNFLSLGTYETKLYIKPFVPGEVCKETWKKLRDNYRKAKQLRKTKSGQGAKTLRPIKFEKELAFLNPHFQQPPELQASNLSVPSSGDEDDADNSIQQPTECFSEPATPDSVKSVSSASTSRLSDGLKRKRMHVQQSPMQEYLQFKREQQTLQQADKHPLDVFFSSMAATVKTFPAALQIKIKQQIFHLITDTEASLITSGNSIPGPSQYAVQTEASPPSQNASHNISAGAGPSQYARQTLGSVSGTTDYHNVPQNFSK